jgi:putative hydrolase of the HAD superfamily
LGAREAFKAFLSERHKVTVYEGALSVLTALGEHYQLGALTNGNADVRKTPIGQYFDYAWRAEEFGVSKPDPELFNQAFAQAGVLATQVIHVGDCHDNDVAGAVSAGATAIWFSPAGGTSSLAAGVVKKLADLPGVIRDLTGLGREQ